MKLYKIKNENNIESYDYLLKLLIFNLTKEKVDELLNQQKKMEDELKILSKKSPTNLWEEDLNILEEYLNKIKY